MALFSRSLLALIVGQIGLHACMAGIRLAAPLLALHQGHAAWAVGVLMALFVGATVWQQVGSTRQSVGEEIAAANQVATRLLTRVSLVYQSAGLDGMVFVESNQLRKVAGMQTRDLPEGVVHEVIHRDDLVLLPTA